MGPESFGSYTSCRIETITFSRLEKQIRHMACNKRKSTFRTLVTVTCHLGPACTVRAGEIETEFCDHSRFCARPACTVCAGEIETEFCDHSRFCAKVGLLKTEK